MSTSKEHQKNMITKYVCRKNSKHILLCIKLLMIKFFSFNGLLIVIVNFVNI